MFWKRGMVVPGSGHGETVCGVGEGRQGEELRC